jgi:hypothetical protein
MEIIARLRKERGGYDQHALYYVGVDVKRTVYITFVDLDVLDYLHLY